MVEVSYKREINHNYMIIVSPAGVENGYECRMLAGNCIEGLLKFRIRHQEDKKDFYYEITSKQPLKRLYEQRPIKGDEIRRLLLEIAATLEKVEEYLLREEQILLDPEYIYIEPDLFSVYLCMVPGYSGDFPAAFTRLLEYLLEKVDHKDKDGVVLAYHLYHESLKQNYGMSDLLKYLSKEDGPIFERAKPPQELPDDGEAADREAGGNRQVGDERGPVAGEPVAGRLMAGKPIVEKPVAGRLMAGEPMVGRPMIGKPTMGAQPEISNRQAAKQREKKQKHAVRKHKNHRTEKSELFPGGKGANDRELLETAEKAALTVVLGLAALWFLAGEEAVARYGLIFGAAVLGVFLLRAIILSKISRNKENKSEPLAGRQEQDSWKIDFSAQTDNALLTQPPNRGEAKAEGQGWEGAGWNDTVAENAQNRADKEEETGTALLADFSSRGGPALLESLSRERESIEIAYVPFIIGKHTDMTDYCLNQPTISRLHLRIDKKEGVYIATDLNSTNGTTVEGYHLQANETVSIKNGDVIYLADLGFRFIEPES